jgi:hypothetical protein
MQNNYVRNSFFKFFTLFIMKLFFGPSFYIAFFMLACSPLGGQARGKPRYPT